MQQNQLMRSKKPHTKSRLGCQQCKKRRTKCDENRPSCETCKRRGVECSFLMLIPTSQLSVGSSSSRQNAEANDSDLNSVSNTKYSSSTSISSDTQLTIRSISPSNFSSVCSLSSSQSLVATSRNPGSMSSTGQQIPPADFYRQFELAKVPIPRFLPYNEAWKTIRDPLPSRLREIFDHYQYTTSLTFADDSPAMAIWQFHVPELACRHDFLVNGVLSVASLHLGYLYEQEEGDKKEFMVALAADQMNKALVSFRNELESINQDNAAALFACSALTTIFVFRTSAMEFGALRASTSTLTADMTTRLMNLALKIVWAIRGPLSVVLSSKDWLRSGEMSAVTTREWRIMPKPRILVTEKALEDDHRLQKIESLWSRPDLPKQPHHQILSQALSLLRDVYALVSKLASEATTSQGQSVPYLVDETRVGDLIDRGAIFVWGALIAREFVTLLEARNRDALVILAHWGVLLDRVREVWWLEDLGFNIVTAVAMTLGPQNTHLIDWPAQSVGVDLRNPLRAREHNAETATGNYTFQLYKPNN